MRRAVSGLFLGRLRQAAFLALLLITAQHGALLHELGHYSQAQSVQVDAATGASDATCALCPVFAQASSPAFSHAFVLPELLRAEFVRAATLLFAVVDTAIPRPRSRGPPSLR
jgi:hypothetical protein